MQVIDSKSGSTATGLIVLRALDLIHHQEQNFETVVQKLKLLINHIEHVFTITYAFF